MHALRFLYMFEVVEVYTGLIGYQDEKDESSHSILAQKKTRMIKIAVAFLMLCVMICYILVCFPMFVHPGDPVNTANVRSLTVRYLSVRSPSVKAFSVRDCQKTNIWPNPKTAKTTEQVSKTKENKQKQKQIREKKRAP